jgi:hypothetical protein
VVQCRGLNCFVIIEAFLLSHQLSLTRQGNPSPQGVASLESKSHHHELTRNRI